MKKKTAAAAVCILLVLAAAAGFLLYRSKQKPVFEGNLVLGKEQNLYSDKALRAMAPWSEAYAGKVTANVLEFTRNGDGSAAMVIEVKAPDMRSLIEECIEANKDRDDEAMMSEFVESEMTSRLNAGDYQMLDTRVELNAERRDGIWYPKYTTEWFDAVEGSMISMLQEQLDTIGGGESSGTK